MGESIIALNKDLDEHKGRIQNLHAQLSMDELHRARLSDEIAGAKRLAQEAEARKAALESERDALARALGAESEKALAQIEEISKAEEQWTAAFNDLQAKLSAEVQSRGRAEAAVTELRGQMTTLSEALARAIQERDAIAGRSGGWEHERAELIKRLQDKDATIASLSATFQRLAKGT
jgi:chromosome segregation ATPase